MTTPTPLATPPGDGPKNPPLTQTAAHHRDGARSQRAIEDAATRDDDGTTRRRAASRLSRRSALQTSARPPLTPNFCAALLSAWVGGAALGAAGCGSQAIRAAPPDPEGPVVAVAAEVYESARTRLLDDYEPWIGPMRLPRGTRATVDVPAPSGWCYAWLAVGGNGVRDIDLTAVEADGRPAGSDSMLDATPYIQFCESRSTEVAVTVRVVRGRGDVWFGVVRKPD